MIRANCAWRLKEARSERDRMKAERDEYRRLCMAASGKAKIAAMQLERLEAQRDEALKLIEEDSDIFGVAYDAADACFPTSAANMYLPQAVREALTAAVAETRRILSGERERVSDES